MELDSLQSIFYICIAQFKTDFQKYDLEIRKIL
jgi:hypothetical protein